MAAASVSGKDIINSVCYAESTAHRELSLVLLLKWVSYRFTPYLLYCEAVVGLYDQSFKNVSSVPVSRRFLLIEEKKSHDFKSQKPNI